MMSKMLHFVGLPPGTYTLLADATTAVDDWIGDDMRINPGDKIPIEKITGGESGLIATSMIAKGVAVLIDTAAQSSGGPPQEEKHGSDT